MRVDEAEGDDEEATDDDDDIPARLRGIDPPERFEAVAFLPILTARVRDEVGPAELVFVSIGGVDGTGTVDVHGQSVVSYQYRLGKGRCVMAIVGPLGLVQLDHDACDERPGRPPRCGVADVYKRVGGAGRITLTYMAADTTWQAMVGLPPQTFSIPDGC